jgi:hypothetical protein
METTIPNKPVQSCHNNVHHFHSKAVCLFLPKQATTEVTLQLLSSATSKYWEQRAFEAPAKQPLRRPAASKWQMTPEAIKLMQQVYISYISPDNWLETLPKPQTTQQQIQTLLEPAVAQQTFSFGAHIPNIQSCSQLLAVTAKTLQVHTLSTSLTQSYRLQLN